MAFIDILGFSEMIKNSFKKKNNAVFIQLHQALDEAHKKSFELVKEIIGTLGIPEINVQDKFQYRQFSDNVIFSYEYGPDIAEYELGVYLITTMSDYYERIMLSKHFYVRGGIADGENVSAKNMIFSAALVTAYKYESKIAKYPRIVICKSILHKLNKISKDNIVRTLFPKLFVKDWTGTFFLNPFTMSRGLQEMIRKHPETQQEIQHLINNALQSASHIGNVEPDVSDEVLIELVLDDLQLKFKKHRSKLEIYEKYRWLKEFVDWQDEFASALAFKYY